jgi:hypothetical protein
MLLVLFVLSFSCLAAVSTFLHPMNSFTWMRMASFAKARKSCTLVLFAQSPLGRYSTVAFISVVLGAFCISTSMVDMKLLHVEIKMLLEASAAKAQLLMVLSHCHETM